MKTRASARVGVSPRARARGPKVQGRSALICNPNFFAERFIASAHSLSPSCGPVIRKSLRQRMKARNCASASVCIARSGRRGTRPPGNRSRAGGRRDAAALNRVTPEPFSASATASTSSAGSASTMKRRPLPRARGRRRPGSGAGARRGRRCPAPPRRGRSSGARSGRSWCCPGSRAWRRPAPRPRAPPGRRRRRGRDRPVDQADADLGCLRGDRLRRARSLRESGRRRRQTGEEPEGGEGGLAELCHAGARYQGSSRGLNACSMRIS